jgi:serine/threonine protein kinase
MKKKINLIVNILYAQYLTEIYSLGNIMYYLFFGKSFENEDRDIINQIKDEDFKYILKNTFTNDVEKIPIYEFFEAKFFNKEQKDLKVGFIQKNLELSMEDAEKIAKEIHKYQIPKVIDFDLNFINEQISSNIEHFTSFNENNIFNFVCYNNKENQIEIYQENNSKYSKSEKKL